MKYGIDKMKEKEHNGTREARREKSKYTFMEHRRTEK